MHKAHAAGGGTNDGEGGPSRPLNPGVATYRRIYAEFWYVLGHVALTDGAWPAAPPPSAASSPRRQHRRVVRPHPDAPVPVRLDAALVRGLLQRGVKLGPVGRPDVWLATSLTASSPSTSTQSLSGASSCALSISAPWASPTAGRRRAWRRCCWHTPCWTGARCWPGRGTWRKGSTRRPVRRGRPRKGGGVAPRRRRSRSGRRASGGPWRTWSRWCWGRWCRGCSSIGTGEWSGDGQPRGPCSAVHCHGAATLTAVRLLPPHSNSNLHICIPCASSPSRRSWASCWR